MLITVLGEEPQIKGWLRAKKIALIVTNNPAWKDLSEGWYGQGKRGDSSPGSILSLSHALTFSFFPYHSGPVPSPFRPLTPSPAVGPPTPVILSRRRRIPAFQLVEGRKNCRVAARSSPLSVMKSSLWWPPPFHQGVRGWPCGGPPESRRTAVLPCKDWMRTDQGGRQPCFDGLTKSLLQPQDV